MNWKRIEVKRRQNTLLRALPVNGWMRIGELGAHRGSYHSQDIRKLVKMGLAESKELEGIGVKGGKVSYRVYRKVKIDE